MPYDGRVRAKPTLDPATGARTFSHGTLTDLDIDRRIQKKNSSRQVEIQLQTFA